VFEQAIIELSLKADRLKTSVGITWAKAKAKNDNDAYSKSEK